jgi:hypothetical protein
MKPVPNNVRYLASFCLILFSVLFITSSQQSCKKTSFAEATSHTDFAERFFAVKPGTNPQISRLIRILKQENERHNFLDQLPANISLPLWNKMKVVNNNYAARGDSSETGLMIIPFSTSGSYLEGILVAVPLDTGYNVKYYSSSFLYGICHKQGKNISQAENLLGLFMIMENYLFNRTDFYHVPVDLFPTNARNSTADSTKIASLINIDEGGGGGNNVVITNCSVVPSGVHHPNEEGPCDWKNECEYCSALYCVIGTPNLPELPIPGGGGGVPPPNTPPNTPPTGGGGGGNCTGCPEPPTDCRLPFYVEEPCPTNPVPPPYNPYSAAPLDLDSSITNNFPCFTKILDSIKGYANLNAAAQVALHEIFNVNKKIHLTFVADRNLTKDSLDGDTRTDSAFTTMNPDGTEGIDYFAKIRINYWVLKNSTQEYIAATILHEAIHAYINYKGQQYLNHFIDSTTFKSMFPLFWPFRPIGTRGNFNSFNEKAQHEGMAANYINILAQALRSVNSNPLIRPGLRDSAYEAVSWGGLYETKLWTNMTDTAYRKGFNEVLRDTSLRVPLNVPGYPGYFMQDHRTLKAKAYCL